MISMRYMPPPMATKTRIRSQKFGSQVRAKTFLLLGHSGLAPLKKMKAEKQYQKHGRESFDCAVGIWKLTSPISLLDSRGKEAVLRGTYSWGNQGGDLISALKKDGNDWKIRAIDYTDGRFGKQVKDLIDPAHTFGEIAEE